MIVLYDILEKTNDNDKKLIIVARIWDGRVCAFKRDSMKKVFGLIELFYILIGMVIVQICTCLKFIELQHIQNQVYCMLL